MRTLLATCLSIALAAAPASAASLSDIYSSFFVFGDSLSDNGNLGDVLPDAYYNNPANGGDQYSDGPVFSDILDGDFNDGLPDSDGVITARNYAFGGARALGGTVPDFPTQLTLFLRDISGGGDPFPGTPTLGERPLVSVWFGANDIFGAFQTLLGDVVAALDAPLLQQPALFLSAIDRSVQTARDAAAVSSALVGAVAATPELNDFLVFNLPDIGSTPAFNAIPLISDLATGLSAEYNLALAQNLAALPDAGEIMQVDIFSIFSELLGDPAQLGLTNVTDACFGEAGACADPSSFLFWDLVHPTGVTHAELADRLIQMLTAGSDTAPVTSLFETQTLSTRGMAILSAHSSMAAVPVPAALPMLVAAILVLGTLGRRVRRNS